MVTRIEWATTIVAQGSVRVVTVFVYRDNSHLWARARERALDLVCVYAVWGELVFCNVLVDVPRDEKSLALARAEVHCRNAECYDFYELSQLCFVCFVVVREDWFAVY